MRFFRNDAVGVSGFTLVELSIVLVIIGLIIGGVLTGQQIIQNARITNALNAIQAYQSQFQTYAQNYGALPGDDSSAVLRFPYVTGLTNGNGNGTLDWHFRRRMRRQSGNGNLHGLGGYARCRSGEKSGADLGAAAKSV